MEIIIDVDGVVANLISQILNTVNKLHLQSEATEWEWWKKYPENERETIDKAMRTRQFWQTLPLIKDSKKGINFLRENGHKIIWCTAPYERCPVWVDARSRWLETHFQYKTLDEAIVFTRHKYLISGLVMIDDVELWIDEWGSNNPDGIAYLFKTNLNCKSNRKTIVWEDIINDNFFQYKKNNPIKYT